WLRFRPYPRRRILSSCRMCQSTLLNTSWKLSKSRIITITVTSCAINMGRRQGVFLMHAASNGRTALTRAEVIVVALYILILVALLVPAVLRVRGPMQKSGCANNLRQIGVAIHNYHEDYGRLPPGYFGPIPDQTRCEDSIQQCSWVGCLPLI